MDIEAGGKELSQEMVRELLIAISNSEPDELPSSYNAAENGFPSLDNVRESFNIENGPLTNDNEAETYRSDLISISSMESPDVNMSPVDLKL